MKQKQKELKRKLLKFKRSRIKLINPLTSIEKLRLEHQKNVNEIQQLESDIHIQIIEREIEKEKFIKGDCKRR